MRNEDDLDWCRAVLMLFGIPFHAALPYGPFPWQVNAEEVSGILSLFATVLSTFRMPAFFIMAGLFAGRRVTARGPSAWFHDRVLRLGVPFVSTLLLINWIPAFILGTQAQGSHLSQRWTGWESAETLWISHLWFLRDLLIYCAILAGAASLVATRPGLRRRVLQAATLLQPFALRLAFLAFGVVTALPVRFGVPTSAGPELLGLDLRGLWFYAPFFLLGCALARRPDEWSALRRWQPRRASVTLAAVISFAVARLAGGAPTLLDTLQPLVCLEASVLILAAARRWLSIRNPTVSYLASISLPVYLVHHPLTVLTSLLVIQTNAPPLLGWALTVAIVSAASIGLAGLISSNRVTEFLFNGRTRFSSVVHARAYRSVLASADMPDPRPWSGELSMAVRRHRSGS